MSDVLFSTNENGVATITLNRPDAINSLNYNMLIPIRQKLIEWENSSAVSIVILKGAGSKGFCAGGDVKSLYSAKDNPDKIHHATLFFDEEYKTDQYVYQFSKPIIACLDGIVMGGGVGISYGASHRIVTDRTKWAMPEVNIALFPDVGAAHFLNHAPGYIGRYLALTASIISAADIFYIKAADIYLSSSHTEKLLQEIKDTNWNIESIVLLNDIINSYSQATPKNGTLTLLQSKIDEHFSHSTVEEIIHSLETDYSDFARETKEVLLTKSAMSLKVTLKHLINSEETSLADCFKTDLILAKNFMKHDDFFEGVRSVLIDKDRNPQYKYKKLSDVPDKLVNSFFK